MRACPQIRGELWVRPASRLAAEHLQRLGHTIVTRNHRTRFGELDIVSRFGRALVFSEVKTRRAGRPARPFDALGPGKRAQVRRMALCLPGGGHRPPDDC